MMIDFLREHTRTIGLVLGSFSAVMIADFLLLVTSLGFHWWHPVWGAATDQGLVVLLVGLGVIYNFLSALHLWLNIRAYKQQGYKLLTARRLIASVDRLLLLFLCTVWGLLVLMDQPSALPLKLLGFVWVSGFIAFTVLQVYELRHKRRQTYSNPT